MTKTGRICFAVGVALAPTYIASNHYALAFTPVDAWGTTLSQTIQRPLSFQARRSPVSQTSSCSLQMCICINCSRVTNCAAYHFVEERHEQPHVNPSPDWEPRNGSPTIEVHIRPDGHAMSNELSKMRNEHEGETEAAEAAADLGESFGRDEEGAAALFGSEKYDLTASTTYEYDVTECEDFREDLGTWVRNMPQEIRDANPHFVPT